MAALPSLLTLPGSVRTAADMCSVWLSAMCLDSFKAPYRVKTTYLLYATTALGWVVGGMVGRALYGNPNAKKTVQH